MSTAQPRRFAGLRRKIDTSFEFLSIIVIPCLFFSAITIAMEVLIPGMRTFTLGWVPAGAILDGIAEGIMIIAIEVAMVGCNTAAKEAKKNNDEETAALYSRFGKTFFALFILTIAFKIFGADQITFKLNIAGKEVSQSLDNYLMLVRCTAAGLYSYLCHDSDDHDATVTSPAAQNVVTNLERQVNDLKALIDGFLKGEVNALTRQFSQVVNARVNAAGGQVNGLTTEQVNALIAAQVNAAGGQVNALTEAQVNALVNAQVNAAGERLRRQVNDLVASQVNVPASQVNATGERPRQQITARVNAAGERSEMKNTQKIKATPSKSGDTEKMPAVPNTPPLEAAKMPARPDLKLVKPNIPELFVEGVEPEIVQRVLTEHLINGTAWGKCVGNYLKTITPVKVAYELYLQKQNEVKEPVTGKLQTVNG